MTNKLEVEARLWPVLRFALPSVLGSVFMGLYGVVDGVFVANLVSTDGLSAVNIIIPAMIIVMAFGTMVGAGGRAHVAASIGAGRVREARENFSMLVVLTFAFSLVLSAFMLVFRDPVIHFLGADETIYSLCEDYAIPVFAMLPFSLLGMTFHMFFMAEGRPGIGTALSVAGGVTNIALDYVLLAVAGMGIEGAALASMLGYGVPALGGLLYFTFSRHGNLCFVRPRFKLRVLLKVMGNGASEMVSSIAGSVITIALNNILMDLAGSDGVAAMTVVFYVESILSSAYLGYSEGVAALVSYRFGAQDRARVHALDSLNLKVIGVASVLTYLLSLPVSTTLIEVFARQGTPVFDLAVAGFPLYAPCFLFIGLSVYVSAFFTALNDGKTSAIVSFARGFVFTMIPLLVMPALMGLPGVWLTFTVAEFLGAVFALAVLRRSEWR